MERSSCGETMGGGGIKRRLGVVDGKMDRASCQEREKGGEKGEESRRRA